MLRSAIVSLSIALTVASVPGILARAESPSQVATSVFQVSQATNAEIASGSFRTVEQDHPTSGTATILVEGGQRYLEFSSDFTTARGPDVEVILYRGNTVPVNLQEGTYIVLAPLQSFDGVQRYAIPSDVNLAEFEAVGIWCRQFNVTFGYADI